jgi:hypothetical protein
MCIISLPIPGKRTSSNTPGLPVRHQALQGSIQMIQEPEILVLQTILLQLGGKESSN